MHCISSLHYQSLSIKEPIILLLTRYRRVNMRFNSLPDLINPSSDLIIVQFQATIPRRCADRNEAVNIRDKVQRNNNHRHQEQTDKQKARAIRHGLLMGNVPCYAINKVYAVAVWFISSLKLTDFSTTFALASTLSTACSSSATLRMLFSSSLFLP